jgi:two-component system, NarL family, sensor histidine kinase UhpB
MALDPGIPDDGTRLDLSEARRAHVIERFPVLVVLNMVATALWLASLVWTEDVTVSEALATAAAQLAILVPAALVCRSRSAAPFVVPIAVAASALVAVSWIALFAVSGASGIVLGFVVFVVFAGAGIGMAWGLGPQLLLQGSVVLAWMVALPMLMKRLAFSERLAVAGLGSVIALVIAAWAARMFRDEQRRRFDERRLSNELRESRDRFRDIYENARDYIWMADLKGRLTYVNEALARLHDRPAAEIVGQTIADLLTDDPANPPRAEWRPGIAHVRAGERLPPMIVQVRSASGPRWMETVISPVRDAAGHVVGLQATSRDVTERREAEEALRESEARYRRLVDELRTSEEKLRFLAQRQVAVREEERKRLGFDLHDDVCQELVGIGILVESSRGRLGSTHEVAPDLQRVAHYLGEVVEHVRLLARELRPMLLHDLGLEDSLLSLTTGLATPLTAVRATFPTRVPRLEEGAELAVYRIAQEALTNASRHAEARTIVLTLSTDERTLVLEVRDDGRGFDADARHHAALGLVSMQERALALGGRLEVRSTPGAGTIIRLVCPLAERSPASAA